MEVRRAMHKFEGLKGWPAGAFFGSLAYPLFHALRGGIPSFLVYSLMSLVLLTVGLALFGSSWLSTQVAAFVYIGLALVLVLAGPFLTMAVAPLVGR
jgi:hypothetical protein